MHRQLFVSLALVAPLTVVLLTATPAGALSVPTVSLSPVPVLPVALPSPSLPPLPQLPAPTATSSAVTLPAVALLAPQLPLSDVTDTIADLAAPLAPPAAPSLPTPAALGLPPAVPTPVRTAADDLGARTSGAGLPAQSTAGAPASAGKPTPGIPRQRVGAPARREGARQRLRTDPRVSRSRTRGGFFGWFGVFMPFTGRDILEMVRLAVAVLCVGLASMVAARLPRPA